MVLDEATAFTDPENEAVIQASIAGLVAGKTLIVIAHRLSTITKADKILVMDKGNVAAEGTHEELLETSNLYKELWKAHMQAEIPQRRWRDDKVVSKTFVVLWLTEEASYPLFPCIPCQLIL